MSFLREKKGKNYLIFAAKEEAAKDWYRAYEQQAAGEEYYFVYDTDALNDRTEYPLCLTSKEWGKRKASTDSKGRIIFTSLEDMLDGYKIPPVEYDMLIADKSLENAYRDNAYRDKTYDILRKIRRRYTLFLSGTFAIYLKAEQERQAELKRARETAWSEPSMDEDPAEPKQRDDAIEEQDGVENGFSIFPLRPTPRHSKGMFEGEGNAETGPVENQKAEALPETLSQELRLHSAAMQNAANRNLSPVDANDFLKPDPERKKMLEEIQQKLSRIRTEMNRAFENHEDDKARDLRACLDGCEAKRTQLKKDDQERIRDGLEAIMSNIEQTDKRLDEIKRQLENYRLVIERDKESLEILKNHLKAENTE